MRKQQWISEYIPFIFLLNKCSSEAGRHWQFAWLFSLWSRSLIVCLRSVCMKIPKLSYKLPIQMCPSVWKVDAPSTFLPAATDTLTVLKSTGTCTSSNSSNKVLLCETDRTIFFSSSLWLHLCNLIAKTEAMLFEVKYLIPGIGILVSKAFIVKEIGHDLYKVKNRGRKSPWIPDLKSKFLEKNIRVGGRK